MQEGSDKNDERLILVHSDPLEHTLCLHILEAMCVLANL